MNHQTAISSNHLQTIYRVMLKRIAKSYSAERLSFLIGKDHDYIEHVEALVLPVYSSAELESIGQALEENNYRSFYARVNDETMLNIVTERLEHQNVLNHSYSKMEDNGQGCQLFMLREELFGAFEDAVNGNENLQIAVDAIDLMIRGGYFFESKKPVEILHSVNAFLTEPIDPFYIQLAMMRFCKDYQKSGKVYVDEAVLKINKEYLKTFFDLSHDESLSQKQKEQKSMKLLSRWMNLVQTLINYPREMILEDGGKFYITFDYFLVSLICRLSIRRHLTDQMRYMSEMAAQKRSF